MWQKRLRGVRDFKAIHARHSDVRYHEIDLRVFFQNGERGNAVVGFMNEISIVTQSFRQEHQKDRITTMSKSQLVWKKKPADKDYAGALAFLSLIIPVAKSEKLVRMLGKADTIEHAAKDLLRASNLPLLARDEPHVDDDLQKIRKGKSLAPVLLIRGDISKGVPLIVADGYHRICAICYYDENAPIACRMVNGPI